MRVLLLILSLLAAATPALAAPYFANHTLMTYDPGHGTQVEYYDNAGHSWLWYPGNRNVLPGAWKLDGASLCFNYGPQSYNPVTRQVGGWECMPLTVHKQTVVETAKGDVFHLKGAGPVPFVLSPARTSIARLLHGDTAPAKAAPNAPAGTPSTPPASASPYERAASTPAAKIPALCDEIIARQNSSKAAMADAAHLLFNGQLMGQHCVKVDYVKAITLMKASGNFAEYNILVHALRERAASGNALAVSAVAKLKL